MVRRLEALAEAQPLDVNIFRNAERAARLEAMPVPEEPFEAMRHLYRLGSERLRAGRNEDAVAALLDGLAALEVAPPGDGKSAVRRSLRFELGLAWLRAGEERNCLTGHRPESCLLPIAGDGIHRDPAPAERALEVFGELLADDAEDLEALWLYNLSAMTLGRYPEAVPEAWRVPTAAFDSTGELPRFPDAAHDLGLALVGLAGGAVFDDFDGDGRLDGVISSWGVSDPLRFLRSGDDGRFRDATRDAGLEGLTGGLNLVPADFDGDADLDILVLRGAWLGSGGRQPNSLLRNDGGGRFSDVTESAGLLSFHPTQTAVWTDYDLDGDLDLFVGNESVPGQRHPCQLFENDGAGTFRDVAPAEGAAVVGFVKGVTAGDFDGDGDPDLYLSILNAPNVLLVNGGGEASPRFTDGAADAGVEEPLNSFPTFSFDYDNDGRQDLFVSGYLGVFEKASPVAVVMDLLGRNAEGLAPRLYRNAGDGTFEDVTGSAGLETALITMGINFGDLDNDGWLDFYAATGAPSFAAVVPNRMLRNEEGRGFLDVTTTGGFGHLQKGHAISFVDIDGDGDQDVHAVMGGAFSGDVFPNALFLNPGNDNDWVVLRLRDDTTANRLAFGARVEVVVDSGRGRRSIHRTVGTGGSFGASPVDVHVGLGEAATIDRVLVRWPGSAEPEEFTGLEPRGVHRLQRGSGPSTTREPSS